MKKTLYFTLLIFISFHSKAQISITNSDIGILNKRMIETDCDSSLNSPGNSGPNQIWDFSFLSLLPVNSIDTTFYINPSSTPYFSNFSSSNVCQKQFGGFCDSSFVYFINDTNSFKKIGDSGYNCFALADTLNQIMVPVPGTSNYNPEDILLTYPVNFTNNASSNSVIIYKVKNPVGADSVVLKTTLTRIDTVDAWGTLILPLGSFNTLRIKSVRYTTDSLTGYINDTVAYSTVMNYTNVDYSWYTKNMGNSILNISSDTAEMDFYVTYMSSIPQNITDIEEEVQKNQPLVYPNPTSDILRIKNIKNGKRIKIYSVSGELIDSIILTDDNVTIDVITYAPGLYLYQLETKENIFQQGKFTVIR